MIQLMLPNSIFLFSPYSCLLDLRLLLYHLPQSISVVTSGMFVRAMLQVMQHFFIPIFRFVLLQ